MPRFELGQLDLEVLYKTPDGVAAPTNGATLAAYRQGATVSVGGTINAGASLPISVYNVGAIAAVTAEKVFVNTVTGTLLDVTSTTYGSIVLTNNTAGPVTINQYDRLIPWTRRPTLYRDEKATVSLGSSLTTNAYGHASAYAAERALDFVASGGGLATAELLLDVAAVGGGEVIDPTEWGITYRSADDQTGALDALFDYLNDIGPTSPVVEWGPGTVTSTKKHSLLTNEVLFRCRSTIFTVDSGTEEFLSVEGTDFVLEGGRFTRLNGNAVASLVVHATAERARVSGTAFRDGGAGVSCFASGVILRELEFYVGAAAARNTLGILVSREGALAQPQDVLIMAPRARHTAASFVGIQVEKGASAVRIVSPVWVPFNPATQGGTALLVQAGGGNQPSDIQVLGGTLSGGYAAYGANVLSGRGIKLVGTHITDSLQGVRHAGGIGHYIGVAAVGCRRQSFIHLGGVAHYTACHSSDASQDGHGVYDHVELSTTHAFIDGLTLGNDARESTVHARHGVHYSGSHTRGACRGVRHSGSTELGVTTNFISTTDAGSVGRSVDISHNDWPRDVSMANTKTVEHVWAAELPLTLTAGGIVDFKQATTVLWNPGGNITVTDATLTGLTEGQRLVMYNKSAFNVVMNHVVGKISNLGAANKTIGPLEKAYYIFINGLLRQELPDVTGSAS